MTAEEKNILKNLERHLKAVNKKLDDVEALDEEVARLNHSVDTILAEVEALNESIDRMTQEVLEA